MAEYKEIIYQKQRGGVLITLNRPEAMNAISRTLIKELHGALDEVEADPEIRAVVVTGAGRAFSAGMDQGKTASGRRRDLHWPYGIPTGQSAAEVIDSWRSESRNFMRLWEFPKPIIGAINGQEALRIGLVVKVVPADQLLDECFSIVERIAHIPPETVKINLQIATMGLQMMGLRDALTLDNQLSAPAHVMLREELRRPLDEARFNEGTKKYLMLRDGPFQPEPFGPRSKKARGLE